MTATATTGPGQWAAPTMDREQRDHLYRRWSELKDERSSWFAHWKELSDYLLPRAGRYFVEDRNRGAKRHHNILDNTATRAVRTMAAGIMAAETSPARPWARLIAQDPELNAWQPVRLWLDDATDKVMRVFAKNNTYLVLQQMYEELGCFGTACSIVQPDFDHVLWHHPVTIGEFMIDASYQGRVDTLYREFQMTVKQMVAEFGYDACSRTVQNLYDRGQLGTWMTVVHAIEPRADSERDKDRRDARHKAWKSCYFEPAGGDVENKLLRESGYDYFPAIVPRWQVQGGDIYGNSPGMECLGDVKGLQLKRKREAQSIDFLSNPPTQSPPGLKNEDIKRFPGANTPTDATSPAGGIRNLFEVRIDLSHLRASIAEDHERINRSFFVDLFLMLANDTRSIPATAREIVERHEEKMLMLGPVATRHENEIQRPLIDMTFTRLLEAGAFGPPPPELAGHELDIEYLSVMSQAQRMVGIGGIDRLVGGLGVIAQLKPEILDKFDHDAWVEEYSDKLGVDPSLVVASDKVAFIRNARAQAEAAKEQAAMMEQNSKTVRALAGSDTSGRNVLTDLDRALSGTR